MITSKAENILLQFEQLKQRKNFKEDQLKQLRLQRDDLNKQIKNKQNDLENTDNLLYTCKLLLEKLVNVSKSNIEQFLTFAIRKIFTDRNYEIKLILKEDSKRPALELVLVEDNIEQSITDAVGGGILATLGLLLQIYYIEVYNLNKTMFIDEGLKEISHNSNTGQSYLGAVLEFLKYLSTERGYTFVIVTHDATVMSYADKLYTVNNGVVTEST